MSALFQCGSERDTPTNIVWARSRDISGLRSNETFEFLVLRVLGLSDVIQKAVKVNHLAPKLSRLCLARR